jgi:hypothetical protein
MSGSKSDKAKNSSEIVFVQFGTIKVSPFEPENSTSRLTLKSVHEARTVKAIALVTLVYLPATFVAVSHNSSHRGSIGDR